MSLQPGTSIGPYRILSRLGAGGMGEVFKAQDERLGRAVALKLLPAPWTSDPERVRRFEREAQAASALNHPTILTVFDVLDSAHGRCLVTELVDGETLRDRIRRGRVPLAEALEIAIQVAGALTVAHAAGIVHRDIKPANIMVRGDGVVKLLDFGIAKLTEETGEAASQATVMSETGTGVAIGTLRYMSPEQARGVHVDQRSDIFSLGVVLHEMLTGASPFPADTPSDLLVAILQAEPVALRGVIPTVPPLLEHTLSRALRKDVDERYQSVKDLRTDLKDVQRALARASDGPASPSAPAARGRRRAPLWIAAAVLAGLAALAAYRSRPEPVEAPAGLVAVPFTSFRGREVNPSFSPDGTQIVFAWDGEDRQFLNLYVKVVGEGRPVRLTTSPTNDMVPAWSPDGRYVAFTRVRPTGGGEIVLIPALGGAERVVLRGSESMRLSPARLPPASLSWFPDGESLALIAGQTDGPLAVFRLAVRTGELTQMTTPPEHTFGDRHVAVSPDGQRLAFTRAESAHWTPTVMYWAPLTDEVLQPRRLPFESADGLWGGLAWWPDSRHLALPTAQGLRRVAIPAVTSDLVSIPGHTVDQPAISRDGRRLAFVMSSSNLDIRRMPGPSATGPSDSALRPFIASTKLDTNPQYSPDGTRIAFTSGRSGTLQTWVCGSDGANCAPLTDFRVGTGSPRWSPDGRFLVFDAAEAGGSTIYVVSADGGAARPLTPLDSHDSRPSVSQDGQWIYHVSNRTGSPQLWKTPAAGGTAVQVTWEGASTSAESHDGRFVYYTKPGIRGIWKRPVDGGTEVVVADRGTMNLWGMYADGLCVIEPLDAGGGTIECLEFASDQWRTLATLPSSIIVHPNAGGPSMSVSADGQWVLFVEATPPESDIMLVENFR